MTEFVGYAPDNLEIAPAPSQLVGLILIIPDLRRCDEGTPVTATCDIGDIPEAPCQLVVEAPDGLCRETVVDPDAVCQTDIVVPDEVCRDDHFDIG